MCIQADKLSIMALRKYYVGLNTPLEKTLKKLEVKLGLDRSNTIRYCISRVAEWENISGDRSKKTGAGAETESRQ
jgi:hypothetical protein